MKFSRIEIKRQHGFGTIEALASIAIGGIMVAAITSTFVVQQKIYDSQEDNTLMVQGTRNAMDLMTREIRMAGYSVTTAPIQGIASVAATQIQVRADLDGDGLTNGGNETISYALDAVNKRILRTDASLGNAESIAGSIDSMLLEYKNQFGNATAVAADVREIKLTITGKTTGRTYVLSSVVTPANVAYNVYNR